MAVAICALDRPFTVFPSTLSSAWMRCQWIDKNTRRGGGRGNATTQHQDHFLLPRVHVSAQTVRNRLCEGGMSAWYPKAWPVLTVWQPPTDTCWCSGPCMGPILCMTMCVSSCWLTKALTLLPMGLPIVLDPVEHISHPELSRSLLMPQLRSGRDPPRDQGCVKINSNSTGKKRQFHL